LWGSADEFLRYGDVTSLCILFGVGVVSAILVHHLGFSKIVIHGKLGERCLSEHIRQFMGHVFF